MGNEFLNHRRRRHHHIREKRCFRNAYAHTQKHWCSVKRVPIFKLSCRFKQKAKQKKEEEVPVNTSHTHGRMVCASLIFDKNETIKDLRGGIQFLHSNLAISAVPVVMMRCYRE